MVETIWHDIRNSPAFLSDLTACGFSEESCITFATDLRLSGCDSVDQFLVSNRKYRDIGTTAIARVLIPKEDDRILFDSRTGDWYRYFLNRMLPPGPPSSLSSVPVSIITFNFDRSLERGLFLAVKSRYDLSDERAGALVDSLGLIHFHGALGARGWPSVGPGARAYVPEVNADRLKACANALTIIYDEVPNDTRFWAGKWIKDAEKVFFLGFGYHHINLENLGILKPERLADKVVHGTAYHMGVGERAAVQQLLPNISLAPSGQECLEFLKETVAIHI